MSLISSPVIQSNLGALMETVATIDPANIGNTAGPSQGLKIRGGARSTVVGTICPPG